MKKTIFIFYLILTTLICDAQEGSVYEYKKIDTLIEFTDASVLIYKNKYGNTVEEIIYKKDQKRGFNIKVDVYFLCDLKYTPANKRIILKD